MEAAREEVEVINSIYENAATLSESTSTVVLEIPDTPVSIKLWIPLHYPQEPPKVNNVNGISKADSRQVQSIIDKTFEPGEVYMFTFIDEVRPLVEQWMQEENEEEQSRTDRALSREDTLDKWISSDLIRDRNSTFIARCIEVHTEAEVKSLLNDILSSKKLFGATHNMISWRIKDSNGVISQSSDNDGESGSGAVLMHLLEIADAQNVLVVVTRFFGGTHLGADRFKHIKNSAKDALKKGGFIK